MSRHSKDESMTVMENESSRHVLEKASSMSAKLTQSSSDLNRKNEFLKFPFDSVLLESKVYRRVCESSWIREVSTAVKGGNESNSSGPASIMSVSSNSAIVSEGDCASSSGHFGASDQHPSNFQNPTIPKEDTHCSLEPASGPPPLELSVSNWSEETGESSSTNPTTKSTLATTISSIGRSSIHRLAIKGNADCNPIRILRGGQWVILTQVLFAIQLIV